LGVDGKLQRQGGAWSVLVEHAWRVDDLGKFSVPSRDFR
jgi:hypothetical protein